MHRTARTAAAFAAAFAAGLAACQAQQPAAAPGPTSRHSAPPTPSAVRSSPAFPGTLSVLTFDTDKPMTLARGGRTVTFGLRYAPGVLARPSPDGQRLALISTPDAGNVVPGSLVVVGAGGARHVLADNLPWRGGVAPTWTPDGTAVVHGDRPRRRPVPGLRGQALDATWKVVRTYPVPAHEEGTPVFYRA
jgi:hypothetical protein